MPTAVKNTVKAAAFLGIFALLLYLLSLLFIPAEGTIDDGVHTLNANGIYGEADNTIDVVFLGDSIVYSAISPLQIWDQYGIPTYCCSTSAQKLWYSEDMLRKAFKKQSPKIVIMETDALFTKFNFDDSILHNAEGFFPILQYHDRWKVLAENTFDDRQEVTSTNEYKGYKISYNIKPSANLSYMKQKLENEAVPNRNKSYFKKIKSYCEDNGAKLILFSCPTTKHWNTARHNNITKLAKDLGLDYIDLNTLTDEVKIDWSMDTRDSGDHLNHFGAVKVTDYIGKYLNDLGVFTDKRSEEAYKSWNTIAEIYMKRTEKAMKKLQG